ncbi:MAG: PLP-dependent aminotransferase family protein [Candidatus Limnocylindria bacterium]
MASRAPAPSRRAGVPDGTIAEGTRLERAARVIHGSFIDETIAIVARAGEGTISFAVGSPAREALDLAHADELAATVLERDGRSALGYGITEGDDELRDIIADAARRRGIQASADDVIVTAGGLQAIDIAIRLFIRPGDMAVVESPGFANVLAALRNHGARVLEVPVDTDGLDVATASRQIAESGASPKVFFVVPNFQNPSGVTLSRARRDALVELAAEHGSIVIEDDPYRELRYRGDDLPPIAAIARDGVVNIGSFSKTFLPGVRVGWAVSDRGTVKRMAAAKQTMDSCTSSLSQRLVVAFHRDRDFAVHVEALRALYRPKQARAREALAEHFGDVAVRWNDPDGGFYLWVELPDALSARRLLDAGLARGVAFVPGDAFAIERDLGSSLRFSYASASLADIDEGVRRLRLAYDDIIDR